VCILEDARSRFCVGNCWIVDGKEWSCTIGISRMNHRGVYGSISKRCDVSEASSVSLVNTSFLARTCAEQMPRESGQPRERVQRYLEHGTHAFFDDTPMGIVFRRISFLGQVPIGCEYASSPHAMQTRNN
jgi:hypothetical protein